MQTSGDMLTKDDLERLIDGFEKAKHDVMERRQTEWRRQGPGRAVTPPDKLEPGLLYPVSSAIRVCSRGLPAMQLSYAYLKFLYMYEWPSGKMEGAAVLA